MAAFGIAPLAVMRSATASAAELLRATDRGVLAPGKLADVVAFAGDPSTNLALLEAPPQLILLGGRRIDP